MILTITANPAIDRVYFVDDFEIGEVHRPERMTYSAGGKGLNVARVSKFLGEDVICMGFTGGYNGKFIQNEVSKLGIINAFTEIRGETRVCVNISVKSGKSGEILEPGPEVFDDEISNFIIAFEENITKCDIISVSGSLPLGVPSDFYASLTEIAKKHNKKIIVDTSGDALLKVIEAKPFMIKPNKFELSKFLGRETDIKEALLLLNDKGIQFPLISLGKDGAAALIDGKFYKFSTPDIPVVNTVGSGDSTIAGICTAISRGEDYISAIKLGMACGTANTQFSQTGTVSRELAEKYYKEIKTEEM